MMRAAFFALLLSLISVSNINAELIPCFNLHGHVHQAKLIVVGELHRDGRFQAKKVLSGSGLDLTKTIPIVSGAEYYKDLKAAMAGKPAHVVLFLGRNAKKQWMPIFGNAGIIELYQGGVYGLFDFQIMKRGPILPAKHQKWFPETFLEAAEKSIAKEKVVRKLLASPRCLARTKTLIAHLCANGQTMINFRRYKLALGMRPIQADELKLLLDAIDQEKDPAKQAILLEAARTIHLPPTVFDRIKKWSLPGVAHDVRREAISNLALMDFDKTLAHLAPMLSWRDPDIDSILLHAVLNNSVGWRSPELLKSLLQLTTDLRQMTKQPGFQRKKFYLAHFWNAVYENAHPQWIPVLYAWAKDPKGLLQEDAARALAVMTHSTLADLKLFEPWWKNHRAFIKAKYDLGTTAGTKAWLNAWEESDGPARKVLEQLWYFQRDVSLEPLLKATSTPQKYQAKRMLALLWKRDCLPGKICTAIVHKHLSVELVQKVYKKYPGFIELKLSGKPDFPFPHVWIEIRSSIVLDNERFKLPKNWGGRGLHEPYDYLGSMSRKAPKAKTAQALLEMRGISSDHKKVKWRAQWKLEPIQLKH